MLKYATYTGYEFNESTAIAKIEIYANEVDYTFVIYYKTSPDKGYNFSCYESTVEKFVNFIDLYCEFDLSVGNFVYQLIKTGNLSKI
jgi:hypothetical protein